MNEQTGAQMQQRGHREAPVDEAAVLGENTQLAIYMGRNMTGVVPGMKNGIFYRGVSKMVDSERAATIRELFPEYQTINLDKLYVNPSGTISDWDTEVAPVLPSNPHVLIIRDMGLGDIILSRPTIEALREKIEETTGCTITFATQRAYWPLLADCSIDEFIEISDVDVQSGKYDLVINWCRALENYRLERNCGRRVDSYSLMLGLGCVSRRADFNPRMDVPAEDAKYAAGLLARIGGPYIAYVLKAAAANRSYPVWRAREVFEQLHRRLPAHRILVLDNQEDFHLFDDLDYVSVLSGQTNIMQAGAVMQRADLVITPDTGLTHLSAALGCPTLVLLSSQGFDWRYDHYGPHVNSIHKHAAACVPCWDWSRGEITGDRACTEAIRRCVRLHDNPCMLTLEPVEIANRAAMLCHKHNHDTAAVANA